MDERFEGILPVITGSSGLIGSKFVNEFIKKEISCIGIDILSNKIKSNFYSFINEEFSSYKIFEELEKYLQKHKNIKTISIMHLAAIDSKHGLKDQTNNIILGDDLEENFEAMIEVNLKEVVKFAKKIIDFCNLKNKKLNLILTPSLYSFVGPDPLIYNDYNLDKIENQKSISYVISKSSIPSLVKYLASTYSSENHRFNSFVPHGVIQDPDPLFVKSFIKKSPMRRLPKFNEIVSPALFLMSNESSYINGQSLIVDGGWSII